MRRDTMTPHNILGRSGSSTNGDCRRWTHGTWLGVLALVLAALALAGCGTGGASQSQVSQHSDTAAGTAAQSTAAQRTGTPAATAVPTLGGSTATDDIPPGRQIAEGGGGPLTYTFREEWRKARSEAQKWRDEAYLIAAVGDFVNDDGVPSSWSLNFIDRAAADAVLVVEIDPWGKVTGTREVTGDEVTSFVSQYTNRIPYSIIDSDHAVGLGKAALASRYDLDKTKDPRIGLNYSSLDGSGPYWVYTIFYESNAEYVSAQVDALTGDVTSLH
jgi:hypothetical protein